MQSIVFFFEGDLIFQYTLKKKNNELSFNDEINNCSYATTCNSLVLFQEPSTTRQRKFNAFSNGRKPPSPL